MHNKSKIFSVVSQLIVNCWNTYFDLKKFSNHQIEISLKEHIWEKRKKNMTGVLDENLHISKKSIDLEYVC